ncbi:MAG: hypothetical protein IKC32_04635 [Clostridia bacterium]|nr:hypothetical protein [Clostridia bacterium]
MNIAYKVGGSEYIRRLIKDAISDGSRTATVVGNYIIDEAIRLPSDFTLILDGCHLRLADGCYSNIFVNEHHDTELGRTVEGADRNITLLGRSSATLDGGEYNGLSERNQLTDERPPIWKNNLLLFTNVDGFHISGIRCVSQRWWALNFIYCRNGYIGDMYFLASDVGVDENGERYHGLIRERYDEVLIKNADGVDIRQGCNNITIENISGFTEDDTIAITGLNGALERAFAVRGLPPDISHIKVKGVAASAFCTIVRLLNQGGVPLHDIEIDGVRDTSGENSYFDLGLYAVRVGDVRLYGERHATADETYNISIRNVYARNTYAVSLAGDMKGITMEGIECADGCKMLLDERISQTK